MLANDIIFPKEANATLIYDFGQSCKYEDANFKKQTNVMKHISK